MTDLLLILATGLALTLAVAIANALTDEWQRRHRRRWPRCPVCGDPVFDPLEHQKLWHL